MALQNYRYAHISTATTTNLSNGIPRELGKVTINGGTAGVITIYDSDDTSGTVIAVIEAIGATNPTTLHYDIATTKGLCVVTAAATDVTVSYR